MWGGSLGTAGHLMGWERPLALGAGPGARSPIAFCPQTPSQTHCDLRPWEGLIGLTSGLALHLSS